ncbi:MAG: apolipoprotein N-acyltransferase [Nitrospirae bacterium RBG_13_39_12]|nr:MAG: apolipoprotein N-acyltransferase [Nitrospirae bacterium RBG_13_39_12]
MPYFLGTLYWIYHSINNYGGISLAVSFIIVILLCLYLSLYTGLFAFLFSVTIKRTKLPALFIAPLFWVVLEFLRSYLFTGFPWSSIGYSQYKFLSVIQIADITGIYGISFLVVAVNGALADIFLIKNRLKDMPLFPLSQTVIGYIVLSLFIISTIIYGQIKLGEEKPGRLFKASIIQGNIEQDKKWESYYQNAVTQTYRKLSLETSFHSPAIIVWPETAVPFFFGTNSEYTKELVDFQRQLNTYLLFGSVLIKGKTGERYLLSNSAVLLDTDGKIVYSYDKIHLVPFGEYVPLHKFLFFINKLVAGIGDYIHGSQYLKADTPFGDFATLICYEVIFPGLVRKFFSNGGEFILNITNDAWFGNTTGPYQHFSMAVFRAVENRKPLIRAANTGISGFIDSKGRIISRTNLFQKTILSGDVAGDSTMTFYTKFGDLFSYIWIVFSVVILTNLIWQGQKGFRG